MADELDKTLAYQDGASGDGSSADEGLQELVPSVGPLWDDEPLDDTLADVPPEQQAHAEAPAGEAPRDAASGEDLLPTTPQLEAPVEDAAAQEQDGRPDQDEASTAPMPSVTAKLPQVGEAPGRTVHASVDVSPRLSDVGATFVSWLRGRATAAGAFASAHRLLLTLAALACVAGVLGVVLHGIDAAKVPPDELVRQDAQARLASPAYTVGDYGTDEPLVLQEVQIESKRQSGSQRGAFEVDVVATFANEALEAQAEGLLTYQREGDEWRCLEATVGRAAYRATAGVSQQRVLAQVENLLQQADSSTGSEPLSALYRDATVEVVSSSFDEAAQTDELVLHCASNGTFVSYECDLTTRFRFAAASGAWELADAQVSKGARDLGFGPLLGTWTGTFASQRASDGKCLAARDAGLSVTITKAAMTDDGGALVEGTVTGVAHLHPDLKDDAAATEGDVQLTDAPFAGTLSSGDVEQDVIGLLAGNNPKRDTAGIVFTCATQDVAGGDVTLTLEFGRASDPAAARATLSSTHVYQDTFLLVVSYQREAHFADTFTLQKLA